MPLPFGSGIFVDFKFYNFASAMKKRLQLFLMIFSFGMLLLPKQMLLAKEPAMDCCTKTAASSMSCHSGKKDSHETKKNCTGDCCTSCNTCSVTNLQAADAVFTLSEITYSIFHKRQVFNYIEPALSLNLKEIWQPPKIS